MKIVEINGYWLERAIAEPLRNSRGSIDSRSALLIELVGEDGNSGWGETQRFPAAVWALIESTLGPLLNGKSIFQRNAIWLDLMRTGGGALTSLAVSAIDIAMWDLRGRIDGRPIADYLGGALRDRVTAYASGPFMTAGDHPYQHVLRDAATYLGQNFVALKLRCGYSPRADAEAIMALRSELGPEVAIMADVNRGYSLSAARDLVHRCSPAGLGWIEEPIDPTDLVGYQQLSSSTQIPIACGESLSELRDFREFVASRAVDLLQPEIYLCGGITGAMRAAAVAEAYNVPCLPHVFGGVINLFASLQLSAVLPGYRLAFGRSYPFFEYDCTDNPLREIVGGLSLNSDGTVSIPVSPGIGVELDKTRLEPFCRQAWHMELDRTT